MLKHRLLSFSLVATGLLLVFSGPAFSQTTAPIRGVVKMEVEGKSVPVADVLVEPYRIDIDSGKGPATKTNKNGEFSFVGFPLGQKFVLAFSGPKISPAFSGTVAPGTENLEMVVYAGDGKVLTESEVRAAAKKSPQGVSTASEADAKKAAAEYQKEKARVEEANKKAEDINRIVNAAIKAGNDAFNAKNYDLAISKYDEGIAADPEFAGSAPVFYNNKGKTLTTKAIDAYNLNTKEADAAARAAGNAQVKKLFADAAESYLKSWNILKTAQAADAQEKASFDSNKTTALRGSAEVFGLAVKTRQVDGSMLEAAKVLLPEYLAVETDAKKKSDASLVTADLYRIAEDRESAISAYKKVLEGSPNNIDALAYLGIVLVDLGWIKDNDKALSQEGANYLQQFVAAAPDTHELKKGAVEYLDILKTQNIVPVKTTTPRRRP